MCGRSLIAWTLTRRTGAELLVAVDVVKALLAAAVNDVVLVHLKAPAVGGLIFGGRDYGIRFPRLRKFEKNVADRSLAIDGTTTPPSVGNTAVSCVASPGPCCPKGVGGDSP